MSKTIALFPGSFNPFTIGHLDIVAKAERIFGFGNVVICFGVNPMKVGDNYIDEMKRNIIRLGKKYLSDKGVL